MRLSFFHVHADLWRLPEQRHGEDAEAVHIWARRSRLLLRVCNATARQPGRAALHKLS